MPTLRPRLVFVLCLTASALIALPTGRAMAQVTVDLHALDAPPGSTPPPPDATVPTHKPVPHHAPPPPHRTTAAKPAEKPSEKPAEAGAAPPAAPAPPGKTPPPPAVAAKPAPSPAPSTPNPPEPPAAVIGVAPPPTPVIPPPAVADAPMAPPPPPTISDTAGTTIDTLPPKEGAGVRLDFASGESDLNPGTADAVKALVAAAPKTDQTTFNVMAYATGAPEDPSTARRLSLSRALSVRSALMAYGVPSTRIYVRALGAQAAGGPADRVDVLVMGANAAAPAPGAPAHAPSATP